MLLPDTPLVTEAIALVSRAIERPIYHHSLRSYGLAAAYARQQAIAYDEEGLALAFLFHDLGFYPPYRRPGCAFQVASSLALHAFLLTHEVAKARLTPLLEAIEWHLQLWPRWSQGPEVGLLQIGTWMDVTGLRRWQVRPVDQALVSQYPRQGFYRCFSRCLLGSMTGVRATLGMLLPGLSRREELEHWPPDRGGTR